MIGIDASLAAGEKTGTGYYVANLIEALAKIDEEHEYLLYPFFGDVIHQDFKRISLNATSNFGIYMKSESALRIKLMRLKHGIDNKRYFNDIELLHCTSFFIPRQYSGPIVSTVYDVSFLNYPECHTEANRLYCLKGTIEAADRCEKIIAISENTKNDIIKYFAVEPERVVVTHLAPREIFKPVADDMKRKDLLMKYGIKKPYIFSLGSLEPRKNLARLIESYALLDEKVRDEYDLVIAGGSGWLNSEIFAEVKNLKLENRVKFTGYVSDKDLPALYSAATIFIYPSLYEGFGLPVVEAMACGIPVITSNNSSLYEIAEGASLLVDPLDEQQIANAISKVAGNEKLIADLKNKSIARAAEFSWRKTAEKTLAVYEACLK